MENSMEVPWKSKNRFAIWPGNPTYGHIPRYVHMLSFFSHVQLFATLWNVTHQAPLFMRFSRQEYWSEYQFSLVQLCLTLCDPMACSTPGLPVHHQLLEPTQTPVYCVGDAIQPSHPLSSPSPPAFNLSQHQGLFQWVNSSHKVAKVLELQLHQSFQWIFRMISFRMDWLALLAVQGTLKSLLQHYSSKASILWHSTFFIVQCSHPYLTIGKTIALTRQTFVGKVMSLLFSMLSRSVITSQ